MKARWGEWRAYHLLRDIVVARDRIDLEGWDVLERQYIRRATVEDAKKLADELNREAKE